MKTLFFEALCLSMLLLCSSCISNNQSNPALEAELMNGNAPLLVRIAEIEVYPEWLDAYLDSARTVGAESVTKESGVVCIFPMHVAEEPCTIRIVEIYRGEEGYQAHIATPHFRAYKEGTPHMIKSLRLVTMSPLDPEHMDTIFKKMNPDRIKEK